MTEVRTLDHVVIRFAGDSGDGMQLTGDRFTADTATFGNDIATLPNFPAEIRAPAGTLPGVSSFQLQFANSDIATPGDHPEVLVAMNPAALKVNLPDLRLGGMIIVDTADFTERNLARIGYATNPLTDGTLDAYQLVALDLTGLAVAAVKDFDLGRKDAARTKNMFALGLLTWLYGRPVEGTEQFLGRRFAARPGIRDSNLAAFRAGHAYGETTETFAVRYEVPPAPMPAGEYRQINGNTASAYGLMVAARKAGMPLFLGSYPITPASDILHELSKHKSQGVMTFQAEDEIAGVAAALGASYGGHLGVTTTSGPGLALKMETIGLGVMTELPLVVIDVQRAGPSTGMPTKTEQSDLLQALFGRNGDSPIPVVAPATPAECFDYAIEAWRIALHHMTPVVYLSDAFLATGSEPWRIPELDSLPDLRVPNRTERAGFYPYERDPETLARPWAVPGTPGLEHRIGGLEKLDGLGTISYDPENHHRMQQLRAEKIARIARDIPPLEVFGPPEGELLILGWGSTYGAIRSAVERLQGTGRKVSHAHLRHLNPFPTNTGDVVRAFDRVLIPELNMGQLRMLIRSMFLVDAEGFTLVRGKPFTIREILAKAEQVLGDR